MTMTMSVNFHTRGERFKVKPYDLGTNGMSINIASGQGDISLFFDNVEEAQLLALDILDALRADGLKA